MGAYKRKLMAAILTLAVAIAPGLGAASAYAEWGPNGTDAYGPGEGLGGIGSLFSQTDPAPVPDEPADVSNPLGTYDAQTGLYTNPYFGLSAVLDDDWEIQSLTSSDLDAAYDLLVQQGATQDLVAINQDDMQILYSMVLINETHETVDETFLENNGDMLAQQLVGFDRSMTVVDSSTSSTSIIESGASLSLAVMDMQVMVAQEDAQIPVFVKMGFISQGDFIQMVAAITYVEDSTADVFDLIGPYAPSAYPSVGQREVLGTLSHETHRYENAYFDLGYTVQDDWVLCGAGLEEELDAAASALANNDIATDMVLQNTATGQAMAGLILANTEGAQVDEEFALDMGDLAFCAFLNASGIIMDPEFFGEDFSFLMAYANEVDPKILDAQQIEMVDSGSLTSMAAGYMAPCIHAEVTATCDDGDRVLPLYVTIAYIPQGEYVYLLGAASYDTDTTLDLLEMIESGQALADPGTEGTPTGTEGTPGGTEGTPTGTDQGGWTTAEVRYQFEHSMLRRYFYDNPANMLGFLADDDLYTLWESVATENGAPVVYSPSDYAEHWYVCDDGTQLLQIELPQPDDNLLCYRIYFLYNPQTGQAGYYTMEYDNFMGDACFACMWDADGTHYDFGPVDVLYKDDPNYAQELEDEARMVLELAEVSSESMVEMAA